MKNINKGLGYLAVAIIVSVVVITTKDSGAALLITLIGFGFISCMDG